MLSERQYYGVADETTGMKLAEVDLTLELIIVYQTLFLQVNI